MKYYTLNEVAKLLGVTYGQVFEMTTGRTKPILWPAANFDIAVKVKRLVHNKNTDPLGANAYGWGVGHTTVEENLTGCYSVSSTENGPLLKWNNSDRAKVGILTHDGLTYYVIGNRAIKKIDLRISSTSLASYMDEEGIPVPENLHSDSLIQDNGEANESQPNKNKGGRHQSPHSEAIEFVYKKFLEEGNTEILRSGKIREFLKRLKELADEKGNRNFSKYVADRIESVKIFESGCIVTTKEQILKCSERRDRVEKGSDYNQQEVSKQLTIMRKKYPLKM